MTFSVSQEMNVTPLCHSERKMPLQFYLNSLRLALQEFFPHKPPSFTRRDCKILMTAIFGRGPSDAEMDAIFQSFSELSSSKLEQVVRNLVYLKRRDIVADVFSVVDANFRGHFDEDNLKEVWEAAAKRLEWSDVLGCFRELCPEGRMSYFDFGVVCRGLLG